MPSLFCVVATEQTPRLYVSQSSLVETLRALRSWPYSHTRYSYVFEPRKMFEHTPQGDPQGHIQLPMVGKVTPINAVETHQYSLGMALDDLPPDEALLRAQQAVDYLSKKMEHYEERLKPEQPTGGLNA